MLSCSVVIATRNRPEMLEDCLNSLACQTSPASEIIIVDASDDAASREVAERSSASSRCPVSYERARVMGASQQRNQGAESASADILVFVDDDAVPERGFLGALCDVFETDTAHSIGGVGGTIVNQTFVPLSRLNRLLLRICSGVDEEDLAGRLVGPGITFLPEDRPDTVQPVEWLNTTGTAYRKDVFMQFRFDENVLYPLEDVHLSARIGRCYRLMNSTKARLFHNDLGKITKRNWERTGEGMMLSRHSVAAHVLGKSGLQLYPPLLGYELVYSTMAMLWNAGHGPDFPQLTSLLAGKMKGALRIIQGRTLPRPAGPRAPLGDSK